MDAYKIGQFIKQLRTERNLSQYQLADMIPITRQAVSKWERGVSVADSLTLIKLAEIFDVTVDELLTGERKNKDTSDKMKEVTLSMVDENISKGKKIKKIVIVNVIIVAVLALLFLAYYFFNSYNSMKFYRVSGKSENFLQDKGILVVTKQKIYFQSGKIECADDIKINELNLYLKNGKKEYLIYSNNDSNFLIIDHFGYNSYFKYNDIDKLIKKLYLEIVYNDDKKEKIHLQITNDFSNTNLLFFDVSTLLDKVRLKNNAKLLPKEIIDKDDSTTKNSKEDNKSKNKSKSENDIKDKLENKNTDKNANIENVFDYNKVEDKIESNDKSKEYEKILYYLENKDLMIKMIKQNFKLDTSRSTPVYIFSNAKNDENINVSYHEKNNVLNIYAKLENKKYECFWELNFDMIMLSIYENNNLVSEKYIYPHDIISKDENYQLLTKIIFKYFEIFLN